LPDAKRTKPGSARPALEPPADPRLALAQKYLNAAKVDEAAREAEKPRRERVQTGSRGPRAFSLSIAPPTYIHIVLAMLAFTFAALSMLVCYHFLLINVALGRVVALPVGMIVAAALSYVSILYLGVIESTSEGQTNVESLQGDWREWFWTLPSSLGMLAAAAFVGWLLSIALPLNVWLEIALSVLLLYPVLQLSALETGSPFQPLSLPVLQSFVKHPFGWFIMYGISFALAQALWMIAQKAWHDPPYSTVAIMAPIATVALFFYAWLLGQLASLISVENKK
jgi:hypothetical protein